MVRIYDFPGWQRSATLCGSGHNYNNFVKNFKKRVEGDAEIYNDIIYNWKNQYDQYHLPAYEREEFVIDDYREIVRLFWMEGIKQAIDDGRVDNY